MSVFTFAYAEVAEKPNGCPTLRPYYFNFHNIACLLKWYASFRELFKHVIKIE